MCFTNCVCAFELDDASVSRVSTRINAKPTPCGALNRATTQLPHAARSCNASAMGWQEKPNSTSGGGNAPNGFLLSFGNGLRSVNTFARISSTAAAGVGPTP